MGDDNQWINAISKEELAKWRAGPGPSPLRDVWTPPGPTTPEGDLENTASSTHFDLSSQPHALNSTSPVQVTARSDFTRYEPEQTAQNTEPHIPSSDTNDSMIGISIRLDKRQPTEDAVIFLRIENHVYLDIDLPLQLPVTWNAIQVPHTTSVKRVDVPNDGENIIPLMLDIIVRGATTRQECVYVCDQCEERVGQRMGRPSLINFHSPSNIIRPKNGTVDVHFTFCCYSRHHRKEDKQYILEVVLKDPSDPSGPRVVAKKEIPYYFDVIAKPPPRNKKRTNNETEHNNIGPSRKSRRTKSLDPANTFTVQLEAVPHPEGIETQTPQEQVVVEELPDRDYARQRTIRHVSSMGQSQHHQQSPNDVQCLPPANPASRLSNVPTAAPRLQAVHPRCGSASGGAEIWLFGANFPDNLTLFVRFGASVAKTSWISPCLLSCYLPSSSHSGAVEVKLSCSPDPAAPLIGTSAASFKYNTGSTHFLRFLSRILGLHRSLNKTVDETAMIEVLGSLHESPDFRTLISLRNEYGQTLAHWSVLSGQTRLLENLIRWGINLNAADINGFTALHCAYLKKDSRSVGALEGNGAPQLVEDNIGRVPAKLAPDDFSKTIAPLEPESELEAEEECPELVATSDSDIDDDEDEEIDALHSSLLSDKDRGSLEDNQDSVTIHSEDSPLSLGNTNLRYHERAESEVKLVTDSESPKVDEVRKTGVERLDQMVENRCNGTCFQDTSPCPLHAPTPDAPSASDPGAQYLFTGVADESIRKEQPCDTPNNIPAHQGFATNTNTFAPIHRLSVEPLRIPTDTESDHTRAIVAEREARINALEAKIRDLRAAFETENKERVDALRPIMDHMHSQILAIQKEMKDHWTAFLTETQEAEVAAEVIQEKNATLLHVMGPLHGRILTIQKEMADRWAAFSAERQEAEAAVTAMVIHLDVHTNTLKHENYNAASFLAPIRRLPVEILAEIFLLSTDCHLRSPFDLMHVCRRWRAIVFTAPRIWLNLRLCTRTKIDKVGFALKRTGDSPLDVEIDTGMDVSEVVDTNELRPYAGLELAATEAKRWRNVMITSFPTQLDIHAHSTPEKPAFEFSGPMNALQSFKVKGTCENSVVFDQLLNVVGSSSHEKLTDMELSSPNAIYHLAQPRFASIFRRIVIFKVDVREMREEVDILTQFEQLVTLEAFRLRLPSYPVETDLPLVRTLKYMKIKIVSVQWMAGRTFPNMVECTVIWPHYPETLAPGGGVDLPVCTHFTYDDHLLEPLSNFRIPKLDTLIVRNDAWNKPRGSMQLATVWKGVVGQVASLKPRVLHLDTQCHDQPLINALGMLPELEELYLGLVRPDGLGKKFFRALRARKEKESSQLPSPVMFGLCPNLRTFGIRYRRWIRDYEHDEITPLLHEIVESRQKVGAPLRSVKFWATKDIPDEQAVELRNHTPLIPPLPSGSQRTNKPLETSSRTLDKRQPTEDATIFQRIENHVYLDIHFPSQSPVTWNAIQVPHTTSVKRVDVPSDDETIIPLTLDIIVRGATTRQECIHVCGQCEERMGQRLGRPRLIDFHSSSNIIRPKKGTVHLHFTFCCYSRHHQKKDKQYVLEVVLKDPNDPSGPRVVAQKEIPYFFDVIAKPPPRNKKRTNDEMEGDNIGPSRKRRRTKSLCPATTFTAQLEVAPHPEGIDPQTPQEPMVVGELPDRDYTRRTIRHVSSTDQSQQQQSPSDVQCLPPANPAPRLSSVPTIAPRLQAVHPRHGSASGGAEIWLFGADFPDNLTIYARFGASVAKTSWISPCLLSCYLPPSSHSGEVEVTLSCSPDPAAPLIGTSAGAFKYNTESTHFLRLLSRILGLHRSLNTAVHETTMVEVLGSLHESPGFGNLISLPNEYGQTLAHWSVLSGQTRLLENLIRWGINLNTADINGFTALHCAYLKKDSRSVGALEGNGASQLVEDKIGRVPAKLAPHDFSKTIAPLAPESELEAEEECPELIATDDSDTDDEEDDEMDALHSSLLSDKERGNLEDSRDSVTIHSEDSPLNLGTTNLRYHERAESEARAVTDSESPIDAKVDEVKAGVDQTAENRCDGTCSGADESIREEQSCDAPNIPEHEGFATNSNSFAPIHRLSVEPLRIPTDTERNHTRAIVAEREAQINTLEAKIRDLRATFEKEDQERADALQPIMGHMHSQILAIQKERNDRWTAFLAEPLEAEVEAARVIQENIDALLPVMDQLQDRILAIQKEMADRQSAFSAERREAEAAVTAKVMKFKVHVNTLKYEKYNAVSFLAPIRRLPVEILAEIFLLSVDCRLHSPLDLMHVCRRWRAIVLTTPRIWSSLRLCTWTKTANVGFALKRTGASPLDVEIDTGMDMFKAVGANKRRRYAGLELATRAANRWRNLIITSFPTRLEINTHSTPEKPAFTFSGPMNALQSFKVKGICENSVIFDQLLNVVGSSSHEKLTDVELSSPNAIYHLAQPQFVSIFRRLLTFKVDVRKMLSKVDILTQFEQLVTLEAYGLRLPNYPIETDLPLVRTLKFMKIKGASVQWMAGRTFPNLVKCTVIWPHFPETLAPGGGVDLPVCTHFTYDDRVLNVLPNFRIPKLDTLIVRNDAWSKPKGSAQLAAVWSGAVGQVASLKPRVLHLDTQCHDQHLINALEMLPELEELYLGVFRPDGLCKKFFSALRVGKKRTSQFASPAPMFRLCPNLRTFGIRYRRWILNGEHDKITPLLHKIVQSRQKAGAPLRSVKFWATKDIPDEQAVELCRPTKNTDGES